MNIRYLLVLLVLALLMVIGVLNLMVKVCTNPVAGASTLVVSRENGVELQETTYICQ